MFVDCEGPRCALGGPKGPDLSSRDDEDVMSAGLQLDFDVQSEPGVAGVQLLINGDIDNARVADADGGKATFSAVSLPEGTGVRVKAICTGEKGATSVSERLFNVDTTACAVAVTTPLANASFISPQGSANQQPDASFEIAIAADVGSDCVSYRVGALIEADCAGIDGAAAVPLVAGQGKINSTLTLSAQGAQYACVEVSDGAGNTAYANAPVSFDKRGPQLNIIDPGFALKVNAKGTAGRKADLDTATSECDRPMQVSCDEAGLPVHILTVAGSLPLATATCIGGIASFDSVPLPTKNDGSSYTIRARSTDLNGLVGNSATRSVTADCEAEQVLTFSNLSCGSEKIGTADDQDALAPGIQFDVLVTNTPLTGTQPTLSLSVDQPASTHTSTPVAGVTTFEDVTFTLETQPELEACATDSGGNLSCTGPCPMTVSDL